MTRFALQIALEYHNSMENMNNQEQENINLVEEFEGTPRPVLVEKVKGMLTPEEAKALTKSDLDLILNVAQRYLEQKRTQTVDDALVVGTIARTEAIKMLGGQSLDVYVQNRQGDVLAGGANKVEAMKKAQEMTGV